MLSVKNILALCSGLLFGLGMVISQMVDPAKVLGFLNLFDNWDPSLALVMGGALAVFTPLYHLVIKPRTHSLTGEAMCLPSNNKLDRNLLLGAAIFGMGWGLAGICPGPALTSIVSGQPAIWLFIAAMVSGQLLVSVWQSRSLVLEAQ